MNERLTISMATEWRWPLRLNALRRHINLSVAAAAAALAYIGGTTLVTDPHRARILFLLPPAALALTISPERMFVAWLFAAPLVQGASNGRAFGHGVFKLVFLVPPLLFLVRMATGSLRVRNLWVIDLLPALYLADIFISARWFPSRFTDVESTTVRAIYITIGVSTVAYYFIAFARTSPRFVEEVAAVFIWSGIAVSVFTIVDGLTGWNFWGQIVAQGNIHRAVATFPSPAALGAYLGTCVVFAVAILVFHGPPVLRFPSILLIGLAIPAFFYTYTRGPVIATAIVSFVMAFIANRARWPSVFVLAAAGVLVLASWGYVTSSQVYKDRLSVDTARPRVVLTDVALDLFRKQPLFGHGYGTFDRAKLTIPTTLTDVKIVQSTTSHNTFLTVLAESGVIGLALLVLPWVAIGWRAVAAARHGVIEMWVVGGCVGAAVAYTIGAFLYDARFFPLILALPWITLGLARKVLAEQGTSVLPA